MADGRSKNRSSIASQNALERRPSSPLSTNPDIFSDDYSFEPLGVADGFRPALAPGMPSTSTASSSSFLPSSSSHSASSSSSSSALPRSPRPISPPRSTPLRSVQTSSDEKNSGSAQARKSTMKALPQAAGARTSFSFRYDSSEPSPRRPSTTASEMTQRPMSALSSFTIPRAQSPFVGASGPSHPYGMYPQDTALNRTSTVSTVRTERTYAGPSHPTHPYAMYPQTTAPEPDETPLAASVDIASVGFPGLAQPYARRLGPDGEDADDIIGPDGHTEQLPPYSRYPAAIPSKERPASATPPRAAPSPTPPMILESQESPGDGLLAGAAPRGEVDEADEAGEEEEAGPTPPPPPPAGSGRRRDRVKAKWQEKGNKRTCFGKMPMWVIYFGVFLMIVLAATLGGAVGKYFGKKAADAKMAASMNAPTPT